jgi:hypothetical protein
MAVTSRQVPAGTGSVFLATVPPGPASVVISNAGSVTAWVSAGTAPATTSNGCPVPAGAQVSLTAWQGSAGSPLQVICPSGTNTSLGYIISTAVGGTGP